MSRPAASRKKRSSFAMFVTVIVHSWPLPIPRMQGRPGRHVDRGQLMVAQALPPKFLNRREAGKQLAQKLASYRDRRDVVVLALPRGGVPVAYEVAGELRAPLDVFIVRKLGVPGAEELAM